MFNVYILFFPLLQSLKNPKLQLEILPYKGRVCYIPKKEQPPQKTKLISAVPVSSTLCNLVCSTTKSITSFFNGFALPIKFNPLVWYLRIQTLFKQFLFSHAPFSRINLFPIPTIYVIIFSASISFVSSFHCPIFTYVYTTVFKIHSYNSKILISPLYP